MIIDLWPIWGATIECCICGATDINQWGLPFDSETAELVSNDFHGDWGCKPACRECHGKHAKGLPLDPR